MSYTALYRKWRPLVFEDVVGQKHITETLKNELKVERVAHAYLFCGTRGTGKTSTAKIFSRAINCTDSHDGNPCNTCDVCRGIFDGSIMDVVEIDAASNNGVDNVREIRDEVAYSPSRGKYKVYIIDEVHMLSTGAFNALLKTLEEPPPHVMFILATTEAHKIPATILSRCQRFDFKRITTEYIMERLREIVSKDNIEIDEQAMRLIASAADGSMRDALSILDQCIAFCRGSIAHQDIASILGVVDHSFMFDMAQSIIDGRSDQAMEQIAILITEGRDIVHFIEDMTVHFRNLLMCKVVDKPEEVMDTTIEVSDRLKQQGINLSQEKIINTIKVLSDTHALAKWSSNPRIILEVAVIRMCQPSLDTSVESVLERMNQLEQKVAAGVIVAKASVGPVAENGVNSQNDKSSEMSKRPTVSPKSVSPASPEMKRAISLWPEILNEVKQNGKLALYGHLGEVVVEPTDGNFGIVFKDINATNRMMVARSENIEFLQEIVARLSGCAIKVKCYLEKELRGIQDCEQNDKLGDIAKLKDQFGDAMQVLDE